MKVLSLDASTQALSVALYDSALAASPGMEHFEIAPRAHAARLLPVAQELLADAGWRMSTLDGLAFGCGPGAFTGLRIAAGFIQGLAYGADLPVAPISTLIAIADRAFARHSGHTVRIVQDARMGEIYTADFSRTESVPKYESNERVVKPDVVANHAYRSDWLYAGNGWNVVAESCKRDMPHVCEQWPHAMDMARLGAAVLERGEGVSADKALPVYVRDDVARKPG